MAAASISAGDISCFNRAASRSSEVPAMASAVITTCCSTRVGGSFAPSRRKIGPVARAGGGDSEPDKIDLPQLGGSVSFIAVAAKSAGSLPID